MGQVGIAELLEAGVHFGHQTRRWNPKMRRFIHGERGGIYIIDLLKTQALLAQAQMMMHFRHGLAGSQGLESAERALSLDADLAEAHAVKANYLVREDRQDEANAAIELALRLDPESYEVNASATYFFRELGSDGTRLDLHPRLSRPIPVAGYATLTPFVGGRLTAYDRGASLPSSALSSSALEPRQWQAQRRSRPRRRSPHPRVACAAR